MGLVDKPTFESRGAHGCTNSDYGFAMTTCCERVGVVDDELSDFYWAADNPSRSVSLLEEGECPFCEATTWDLRPLAELAQVPEPWLWATTGKPRPGSRRLRPLSEYVEELLAFAQRKAGALPAHDAICLLNTADPQVRYDNGWVLPTSVLVTPAEFAPKFERLLAAGFSWINLSVYGLWQRRLVIGVELPRTTSAVPVGLTAVNYSGPALSVGGSPLWDLSLTVTD